ncbi:MAG: sensor domain-containing protein, partial [Chloroflexota bacterium]|nr:sensor domain-containing protein [Chloroflexota bacterium]
PDIWSRVVNHLTNPATWKSLLYLMMKFPLGVATFVIVITLVSLTLASLSMPFIYESQQLLQGGGFFSLGLLDWNIDSMLDALLAALIGILLWPLTLHISNAVAWVHAKFAHLMLSNNPIGSATNNV